MSAEDLGDKERTQAIKSYIFWTVVTIIGGYLILVVLPQLI